MNDCFPDDNIFFSRNDKILKRQTLDMILHINAVKIGNIDTLPDKM